MNLLYPKFYSIANDIMAVFQNLTFQAMRNSPLELHVDGNWSPILDK